MKCPHGNGPPEKCSSCLGVLGRRVEIRAGAVAIDGAHVASAREQEVRAADAMHQRPAAVRAARIRGGRRTGSRVRTCTACGESGHNRQKCSRGA